MEHATFIHFKAVLKVWNEDPSQTFGNDSIPKFHACCLEWRSRTCRMTVVSASDIFMDQHHNHSYSKKLHHPWQVITCGFRISHLIYLDLILARVVAASWDKEGAPNRFVPITLYCIIYYIAFNCCPSAFNCFSLLYKRRFTEPFQLLGFFSRNQPLQPQDWVRRTDLHAWQTQNTCRKQRDSPAGLWCYQILLISIIMGIFGIMNNYW